MIGTRVEVFLHGIMREYSIEQPLEAVREMWELEDGLVISHDGKCVYIQRAQCPIVEMSEYNYEGC